MPPPLSSGFNCSTCGKQYLHSSHLRRHEASHLTSEQFTCDYCRKGFRRRDVWRKHYIGCPNNNNQDEPPPAKRGKKVRACDQCFRSKLSCDGNPSCARCTSRQLTCAYTRAQGNVSSVSLPSPNTSQYRTSPGITSASSATPISTNDEATKIPVTFLLSLTNPEAESMVGAFLDEPSRSDDGLDADIPPNTDINTTGTFQAAINDPLFFPWPFSELHSDPFPDLNPFNHHHHDPNLEEGIDPTLQPIVSALEILHTTLTTTEPATYTGTFNPAVAAQVFTRANRDAFLPNYFRHTHKHMPLIHRPSFGAETSAPELVLAVFLCGALYAPPRDCVLAIPAFFHIAEEWVFRRLEALVEAVVQQQQEQHKAGEAALDYLKTEMDLYETFQAAKLVQGAQFLMSNPGVRSKTWLGRKPALIRWVRRLGFTGARHTQEVGVGGRVDWGRWVRDEMRIRIAAWLFLADGQEGGVFHVPGLMTMHEMVGEMPSLQELWEANDATEFEAAIATTGKDCWRRSASLRDCVDALMGDPWSGTDNFPLRYLTMADLYFVISGLHVTIGTARLHSLLQSSIPTLQRATDRWDELWRATVSHLDDETVRVGGFVRHCGEFGWLARAFLEHARAGKDKTSPYFQRIGHETPKELHDLLRELRGV